MLKAFANFKLPAISTTESMASTYDFEFHRLDESTRAWHEPVAVRWGDSVHIVPACVVDRHRVAAIPVPESSGLDVFCDIWTAPDNIEQTLLDHGYDARLRDALRIRGDFDRAIAALGLAEDRVGD